MLRAVLILFFSLPLTAAPLQILAIGDSLSEEYAFEVTFSAPKSDPGDANIRNWPELLRIFRPAEATLGSPYQGTVLSYPDLRNGGHPRNFGVPSFTSLDWLEVITSDQITDTYYSTRAALLDQIPQAEVVVVFLGGNDLKNDYNDLFNDTESPSFLSNIVRNLRLIHQFVFNADATVPIVVCTVPDVGATPNVYNTYDDPAKALAARAKIAQLNQDIIQMVADQNALPGHEVDTRIARIDHITDRTRDEMPFNLNGTVLKIDREPGNFENPPDQVFAHDDFHPATAAQALIANEIILAINAATGSSINPFSEREILDDLLGLDPDQPFLDWIDGYAVSDAGMDGDDDHDMLPNLVEMGLGTAPDRFSTPISGSWKAGEGITWTPDEVAARYLDLFAEESGNLLDWNPVPEERISHNGTSITAKPPAGEPRHFGRLYAKPR